MNRLIRSSALTWALGYLLLALAALVAFAVPLWYAWNVSIFSGREEILRDDAQRLTEVFVHEGVAGLTAHIKARVAMQIAGERTLLLTDSAYRPLAGNLAAWPQGLPDTPGAHAVMVDDLAGQHTHTLLVRRALPGGYHLLVGRDLSLFLPLERRFAWGLTAAVTFLFVVGVAGAILMRRELLVRVEGIRQTVAAIMQGDLRHRLPTRKSGDELDTLSQTLNGMLDHIEHLIAGISNVSNSIAHDLRTPLAELRSRLEELILTRPPSAETFVEIEAAVADVDRVMRIFTALLRLAEIDSGARRSGFVRVDAAAVAAEVVEFYEPAAEQKGVVFSFQTSGEAAVAGDPVLLAQAVSNLIDNSLKSVSERGAISVRVGARADGSVEIAVSDDGPGIPDADKPKAAERFFRGDASRGTPGVGLGLSIVDAVAKLHGGVLHLLDNHPGLIARMVLPAGPLRVPA
ncbi:MAG TPA: ATP-binding protein [Steroidobacteraceae bacterium]|nr:ATP-binding protein [Steroidobacteraceae bacterium]